MINLLSKNFTSKLTTQLIVKFNVIKEIAKEDLKKAIQANVYNVYDPKVYERTYNLIDSVSVSEIKQEGNILTFDLYFDKNILNHTSVVTGEKIFVPPLIDEGHSDGHPTVDYFHNYPARDFINSVLEQIRNDLQKALSEIVKVEVKKIGGKSSYR